MNDIRNLFGGIVKFYVHIKLVGAILVFVISITQIFSANISWTGCFNNNWHYAANWSPAQVPTYLDNVTIPNVATVYPHITGIACAAQLNITSTATDALTIETGVGGILHIGNSAPTPEQRRIVFVSTSAWTSTTSPATRDTRCNQDAGAAGLCGTYKAWVANGGSNNVSSTTNVAYYRTDGTKVADNWADLTDGTLDAAIDKYASGANASGWDVWTGISSNGTVNAATCSNWTNQTFTGRSGLTNQTNSAWTSNSTDDCQYPTYTTVATWVSGANSACANCFPGTISIWTSVSCGSGKDNSCADIPVIWCCCGECKQISGYVAESKRHYCFQQ